MTKEEFLILFELEEIYNKYKDRVSFSFGLFDNLTGTKNEIYYVFNENNIKLICFCTEFNEKPQEFEINLNLNEENIETNQNKTFKNEIFPFLTFETNLDSSLKFIADFINKILKPKHQLMGTISVY